MFEEHSACSEKDLLNNRMKSFWIWCVPLILAFIGTIISHFNFPVVIPGLIGVISTAWIGIGCYVNGRHCGRVHCKIDGILLPLLSIVALLMLLHIIPLRWVNYFSIFWLVLLISYLPEWVWKKYV